MSDQTEQATLGGGCFWCLDAAFVQLRGVERVVSGYIGGKTPNPTYEQVCTGRTGHAEAVQITFNSAVITFDDLLDVFFAIHDPTTLNRQGADAGTQYRSAIFPHSPQQEQLARSKIGALNAAGLWPDPIVTTIEPLTEFFPAETYHQGYYAAHPQQGYCQVVINPKLAKLRQKFADRLRV
jgi:peptide-methionine (S)-S-oxide reductase